MKKSLALILALVIAVSCLGAVVSAEAEPECDLRPIEAEKTNAKIVVEGATLETDANGTATITLTASVATVNVIFKDAEGTYEEVTSQIRDEQKYIRYFFDFGEGITKLEVHGHYKRGDKDDADLYLSGMQNAGTYFVLGGTPEGTYGVWDITKYLADRAERGYVPADGVIEFHDNEFRVEGEIGSVLTIYYYDLADSYEDDFGTVVPDPNIVDVGDDTGDDAGDDTGDDTGDDVLGDFDGDENVTSDDAVYLLRNTLFPDQYPVTAYADFDHDGNVTSDDAVYLLRYTLFPDQYPISK